MTVTLEGAYELDPRVALRPEPFGALAYHYGNRRLVFLRSPDMVRVVESLDEAVSVAHALRHCEIPEARWPSFVQALDNLASSEVIRVR
jgi:putative mycofactocin binding protein MftB